MVSGGGAGNSARFLLATLGIVAIGVLVALATDVGLTVLTPVKLAFILGGVALLIPTMVVEDPTAYWLFQLVLSIPFVISNWLSPLVVDPQTLLDLYRQPPSRSTTASLYL